MSRQSSKLLRIIRDLKKLHCVETVIVEAKAFENVKNQIGYCGIWCGSCIVGNGTLKELSKKYAFILEGYGIDKWGANEQGFDGKEFMKSLQAVQNIPVCRGCLKGGGATNCKIRACATNKKLANCTECTEYMKCENREALHNVRTGALKVGMTAKTEKDKASRQQLIKKWTAEISEKFPSCVVLSKHGSN